MFKRILVAVDGSPASNAGLKSAIALAKDQGAALHILHIVDDAALTLNFEGGYVPAGYVDGLQESLRENGRKILAKVEAAGRAAGVETKTFLVEAKGGSVAHAILAQSRRLRPDVIVLGTHGRRGLRRVLMGSDAETVVREANVPVLLVRKDPARRSSHVSVRGGPMKRSRRQSRNDSVAAAP